MKVIVNDEDVEVDDVLHHCPDVGGDARDVVGRAFDYELVVHLQEHTNVGIVSTDLFKDVYHRDFDDVCRE